MSFVALATVVGWVPASATAADHDTSPMCPAVAPVHRTDHHAFIYAGHLVTPMGSQVTGNWGFWLDGCWIAMQ